MSTKEKIKIEIENIRKTLNTQICLSVYCKPKLNMIVKPNVNRFEKKNVDKNHIKFNFTRDENAFHSEKQTIDKNTFPS